jgi:hypothetical protein
VTLSMEKEALLHVHLRSQGIDAFDSSARINSTYFIFMTRRLIDDCAGLTSALGSCWPLDEGAKRTLEWQPEILPPSFAALTALLLVVVVDFYPCLGRLE